MNGSCHCGELAVKYESPLAAGEIAVRVCQCTFCRRHGGRYTSHPESKLEISCHAEDRLNRYRFGTATADFILCRKCGVAVAAVCELDGKLRAVVNTGVFDGFSASPDRITEHDFDGETRESRLARRQRNWIPEVTFNFHPQ